MTLQEIIAILITVTAVASYINHRFLKLPESIGLTLITLLISLLFIAIRKFGVDPGIPTQHLWHSIDFNTTFMGGMISFLLFAGGLQINVIELLKEKSTVAILATLSVVISTAIVGLAIWSITQFIHTDLNLLDCLLFGALIAPTDPISVLSVLKKVTVPKRLSMRIAGEALFNDGIGIVLFVTLLEIAQGSQIASKQTILLLFLQQLLGGLFIGAFLGLIVNWLISRANVFTVCMLLTLALVTGGYYIAISLHTSGPIAMAVASLVIGFKLSRDGLLPKIRQQLRDIWQLIDEVLNAILFVLIGLAVFQPNLTLNAAVVALAAIPICLIARSISVAIPVVLLAKLQHFSKHAIRIMTWGGLRGGVSIALALSLPDTPAKEEIIMATYAVVVFSIIVQGLTIKPLIKKSITT